MYQQACKKEFNMLNVLMGKGGESLMQLCQTEASELLIALILNRARTILEFVAFYLNIH